MTHLSLSPANLTYGDGTARMWHMTQGATERLTKVLALSESNTVSWQSAFWPVAACTLAVMLQNTGRVCGAALKDSYALRVSPLICAVDTLMMIIKFLWMLRLGCSIRTAGRHVWYDRFLVDDSREEEGFCAFFYRRHQNPGKTTPQQSAGILPTAVGNSGPDLTGETNGQMREETYSMSGALPTPQRVLGDRLSDELDSPEVLHGDEEIADKELEVVASSSAPDNGGVTIDNPLNLPGSTVHLPDCDIEAGITVPAVEHSPLTGIDQYRNVHSGSHIDRAWRLTMAGFLVGALPQAIKIFGMQGIVLTQIIIGIQVSSFMVPEVFRMIAGTAGGLDLHPMPSILFAKDRLELIQQWALFGAAIASFSLGLTFDSFWGFLAISSTSLDSYKCLVLTDLLFVAPLVAFMLHCALKFILELSALKSLRKAIQIPHFIRATRTKVIAMILRLFAVQTPHGDTICVFSLLYLLAVSTTLLPSMRMIVPRAEEPYSMWMVAIALVPNILFVPACLIASYGLFRLFFMGSLSSYPRALFGLKGTWREFETFTFIALQTLALFAVYYYMYNPNGTRKPRWAEVLG